MNLIMNILFNNWIYYYCLGMFKYDMDNLESYNLTTGLMSVMDEMMELIDAIKKKNLGEIWGEFNDVLHAILRLIPLCFYQVPYIGHYLYIMILWVPIFAFITARKHSVRFKNKGCIRSDKNCFNVKNHVCNAKKLE